MQILMSSFMMRPAKNLNAPGSHPLMAKPWWRTAQVDDQA